MCSSTYPLDAGLEGILSKFTTNTNLEGVVESLEGRETLQRAKVKFSKDKCQILYLAWGNPEWTHRLGNDMLEGNPTERDLGGPG